MPDAVLYSVRDGVATITLNRPDRLNAMNDEMFRGLLAAFDQTDADDSVRAVIVTGAGRAFCAGADLGGGARTFDHEGEDAGAEEEHRDSGGILVLRIFRSLKPVIAAINGPAVGVGLSITLPMDTQDHGRQRQGRLRLRRSRHRRRRRRQLVSAAHRRDQPGAGMDADRRGCSRAAEALAGGLVRSICPAAEVVPQATALAAEIAANVAPVSAVLTRQLMWQMLGADHPMAAHRIDSRAIYATGRMPDAAEGIAAFLEKRPPQWTMAPSRDLPDWFPWRPEPPFSEPS